MRGAYYLPFFNDIVFACVDDFVCMCLCMRERERERENKEEGERDIFTHLCLRVQTLACRGT